MNQNSLKTILSFAIVIFVASIVMFFIINPSELSFVPTCLSMLFASVVIVFSIISYGKAREEEGIVINIKKGLLIFLLIIVIIIAIKLFMVI